MAEVIQFEIGNYKNFVYLIIAGPEAMVVDPQADLKPWEQELEKRSLKLTGCLLTHTHWDHVAGVPELARKYMVPIWVHPIDARRLHDLPKYVHRNIKHLDTQVPLIFGGSALHVFHTPGHSAGECCFLLKDQNPWQLLTGDTVFAGDVGRCDLDTGSVSAMFQTIQNLKTLPPDTIVWPGHNYGATVSSTLGHEIKTSAAFRCQTVQELDALP